MTVSPFECIKHFSEKDKAELDKVERELDSKLKVSYHGQGTINISLFYQINDRIKPRLQQRYKEAGWYAMTFRQEHSSDPREPYSATVVTLTGPTGESQR
jgi:hypothetical protein